MQNNMCVMGSVAENTMHVDAAAHAGGGRRTNTSGLTWVVRAATDRRSVPADDAAGVAALANGPAWVCAPG